MRSSDPYGWMFSEAIDLLQRAERMSRQAFEPLRQTASVPCWEPPIDVFETEDELIILASLPGVDPQNVTTTIEEGYLLIRALRDFPEELKSARIHRLELPQGCFQRRIAIPPGRYDQARRTVKNGCIVVSLRKIPAGR